MKRKRFFFPIFLFFLIVGVSHRPYSQALPAHFSELETGLPEPFLDYLEHRASDWTLEEREELIQILRAEALRLQVPDKDPDFRKEEDRVALLLAIMYVESRFQKKAKSSKGAIGLLQMKPSTAQWVSQEFGLDLPYEDLQDPRVSIPLAVTYLNYLISRTGSIEKSLLAYNAGLQGFRNWGGVPKYARDVKKEKNRILQEFN